MGKLNPKRVENLTEPGTYEDGDHLHQQKESTSVISLVSCVSRRVRASFK